LFWLQYTNLMDVASYAKFAMRHSFNQIFKYK